MDDVLIYDGKDEGLYSFGNAERLIQGRKINHNFTNHKIVNGRAHREICLEEPWGVTLVYDGKVGENVTFRLTGLPDGVNEFRRYLSEIERIAATETDILPAVREGGILDDNP